MVSSTLPHFYMLVSSPILPVPFRALFLASFLCTPLLAAPYASGDLLMGFVTGAGEGADDTVIVRLGKSADFRDNFDTARNKLNFVTIGTQLVAKYGAEWYNRTDLYMSIFGSTDSDTIGDTLQNLDPFRTLYASRTRNAAGGVLPASPAPPHGHLAAIPPSPPLPAKWSAPPEAIP